jgi:hypothetical protein
LAASTVLRAAFSGIFSAAACGVCTYSIFIPLTLASFRSASRTVGPYSKAPAAERIPPWIATLPRFSTGLK